MSVMPGGFLLILGVYLVVLAVVGGVVYLVVRFAIRDGLRGHQLWLERTHRTHPAGPNPAPPAD